VFRLIPVLLAIILLGCSTEPDPTVIPPLENQQKSPKVLVIGFDGATWTSLKQALNRGLMPNLSSVIRSGVHGPLKTIRPTLTPVIWTSIATGKSPDKHGITGLLVKDGAGRMRPISSTQRRVKALWQIFSEESRDVCVVRWPVSWPAEEVNGTLISEYGFQTNREKRTFPSTLAPLVDRNKKDFRLNDIKTLTGISLKKYNLLEPSWQWKLMVLLREYNLDILYKDVAKELLQEKQADFTAVYFYSMDALGHSFYKFVESEPNTGEFPDFSNIIPDWCWLYDRFLGELLEFVDSSTYILICSDHGMERAIDPQKFLVRAENDPPRPGEAPEEERLKPGPPFDTDPFSLPLQYTLPSGQHVNAPDGIFVMSGPGIDRNKTVESISVLDIASTILYAMGLPSAKDFDGKIQLNLFNKEFVATHPPDYIDTYEDDALRSKSPSEVLNATEQDDALLLNRLKALGYI
jgi:predicted AlkP superfamily phosphohydrolase/phosphomutase